MIATKKGNQVSATVTNDYDNLFTVAMPSDVARHIILSALDVVDADISTRMTAVITEWHILHESGYTSVPVPEQYRQYVRTGATTSTERDPFADYQTGVQIADALQVRPRTIRKHAQRLRLGTTFGKQRIYSPADAATLRGAVSGGRPAARSETDWR